MAELELPNAKGAGKLPPVAWVAVIGAGVAYGLWKRHNAAPAPAAGNPSADSLTTGAMDAAGGYGGGYYGGSPSSAGDTGSAGGTDTTTGNETGAGSTGSDGSGLPYGPGNPAPLTGTAAGGSTETEAAIAALFGKLGLSPDAGLTNGETAQQRIARLAQEVDTGQRGLVSGTHNVQDSLLWIRQNVVHPRAAALPAARTSTTLTRPAGATNKGTAVRQVSPTVRPGLARVVRR